MNQVAHKPIRVLHVHGDLIAGGGQTLSREWLRASDRSLIDPYVVVLGEPTTLQESFEKAGITVTQIFGSRISQIFKLAKYIKKNKIDVIHTQSEPDRKVGHYAAFFTRTPVVAHLHSEWVYFAKVSPDTRNIGRIRARIALFFRRISERSIVHFVATSKIVEEAFSKHTKKPIVTVEPGVPTTILTFEQREKYRESLNIAADEFVIVNLSRLDSVKKIDDFIYAVHQISRHLKVRAFIAGEGPLREELLGLISKLGMYREIQILSALDDPIDLLGAADLFLATSSYESFGISVLEALSTGVPVVGYDLDTYKRYSGAVQCVEMGNLEALVNECLDLANNSTRYEHVRALAKVAAQKYDINIGTNVLIELDKIYGMPKQK